MIQADLARATGLSAATVSNIVRDLTASGLLEVAPTVSGGRRARAVSLSSGAGAAAAGIDVGRRHIRIAVADLAYVVLGEDEVSIDAQLPAPQVISVVAAQFDALLRRLGVDPASLVAVGVGVPGPIDSRTGEVGSGSILPEWVGVNPAEAIGAALGRPVIVDNDANLGALAQVTWGAARGHRDVAYVKIATGIGAGLVIDGQVHRGSIGTAGEIGHLTMDEHGQVCRCGNRGCLETMASAGVVLELLRSAHGPDLTIGDAVRMAVEGDAASGRVIGDAGRHVGVALAHLCNLLNPSMVVVGGILAEADEILLEPMRSTLRRYSIPPVAASTTVVRSPLGVRAEALGAVALALRAAGWPMGLEKPAA